MNKCTLFQLDEDHGKIYINSGSEAHMICGGQRLALECPEYDFMVERGGEVIWNSRDEKEADAMRQPYRLVRMIGGVASLLAPGERPEHLIEAGNAIAEEHPEWRLMVQDAELNPVWQNEKSAPGKAEDAPQKNG